MTSISIIIPVYNTEPYVRRCLESVMAQNVEDTEIECLLIDDCGTDRSMEIVAEVLAAYQGPVRFRIVRHDKNMGLSMARNTGLMEATGDYVLFVDSDDRLTPDALSLMVGQMQQHAGVDVVIGNVRFGRDNSLLLHHLKEPTYLDDPTDFFRMLLRQQINSHVWNKLLRRQLLLEHQVFFIRDILYEDNPWLYQVFCFAETVLLLPQVVYLYEDNPGSIVNTTQTADNAEVAVRSFTISVNDILDHPPVASRYRGNVTVDYLLFVCNILIIGVDLTLKFPLPDDVEQGFRQVRGRLMHRSLRCGRLILSAFFTVLFTPLNNLQRLRVFRHNFHKLMRAAGYLAHQTDFLHSKRRRI